MEEGLIQEFVKKIRETSGDNVTAFSLFINCEEHEVKIKQRTEEDLQRAGISMRNLKGDFIRV